MNPGTRISFVRHGHVYNPDHILYGRLPNYKLSRWGRDDAARAASFFKDARLCALFTSPMLRARQTGNEILTHHPHLKRRTSSLINEVKTGFEGQPEDKLKTALEDVYHFKDDCYEQPAHILARSRKFIQRIRKSYVQKHVAAVTHGDVILFLMFWVKGIDVTPKNKLRLKKMEGIEEYPATGSITTLTFTTHDSGEIPLISYVHPLKMGCPGISDS